MVLIKVLRSSKIKVHFVGVIKEKHIVWPMF